MYNSRTVELQTIISLHRPRNWGKEVELLKSETQLGEKPHPRVISLHEYMVFCFRDIKPICVVSMTAHGPSALFREHFIEGKWV